jgi:GNAT superfamily N-acetyltransferase
VNTAAQLDAGDDTAGSGHVFRPARPEDLAACAAIWRTAINDYLMRVAQPEIPNDLGAILRLYDHLRTTDPVTFVVAERVEGGPGDATQRADPPIDAFVSVVVRDSLWFLSMLFVLPHAQGRGLGRRLLDAVSRNGRGADAVRATATDSLQPISNALYASLGIVPRLPLFRLVGLPDRRGALPTMPADIEIAAFEEVRADADGIGSAALLGELNALDRDILGFERPADHAFLAGEGRRGFLYCDRAGAARGYGYTSESGRVGPIVVADQGLLGPVAGHLVQAVEPRGAFGIWVPGAAAEAMVPLLRAGLRIDGFPTILCWDRPFADWSRAVPISPGLL